MESCSEYDPSTGRCRSGWPANSVFCKGCGTAWSDRMIPYCMWSDPPKQFIRDDGKPKGWPGGE